MPRARSLLRASFRAITFASLILAVAVVALYVRSYFRHDSFQRQGPDFHGVASVRGHFGAVWTTGQLDNNGLTLYGVPNPADPKWALESVPADAAFLDRSGAQWSFAGFSYQRQPLMGTRVHVVIAPLWAPLLLFSILPLLEFLVLRRRRRRRRRLDQGLCRSCGYDLRATPNRCPECGARDLVGLASHDFA
jgi:hypothetical protein